MASPFPGMDPFIETQKWSGFHHRLINELGNVLVAQLRPRYEVEPEERIYVETTPGDANGFRADVAISEASASSARRQSSAVLDVEPRIYTLQWEEREPFLVVRKTGEREVVTVIEVLSPTNKRPGSDGRREYLSKRNSVLQSSAHLVEIDLLLGGQRLPTLQPLRKNTDYCAFVCRVKQRPNAHVFEWTIQHRLPPIPIPLAEGDPDAVVELQTIVSAVYEHGGYDYSLEYSAPLELPMHAGDGDWLKQVLAARTSG